jgi:hypothetical protein
MCLLLAISTTSVFGQQQAYASSIPSSNMLDVPYHSQETDYYCCVASVQMALQYISGDVVPQGALAKEMHTTKSGTYLDKISVPFHLRGYGVGGGEHMTLDELKKQNSRGYVSIITIWFNLSRKYGHCVVMIGYNTTGIFVNDPGRRGGEGYFITGEKYFISNELLSDLWAIDDKWGLEIPYKSFIYAATLSVESVELVGSELVLDGTGQGWISSVKPRVFYFKVGTIHTISVDKYVNSSRGVRYYADDDTTIYG